MAKTLQLTKSSGDIINIVDSKILRADGIDASNVVVTYFEDEQKRSKRYVRVTSSSFTTAITDSLIISVPTKSGATIYINVNHISEVIANGTGSKISIDEVTLRREYYSTDSLSTIKTAIDNAGGGSGSSEGTVISVNSQDPIEGNVTLTADDIDDSGTTNKFVDANLISKVATLTPISDITLSDDTTTIDFSNGSLQRVTITANTTFTFSGLAGSAVGILIIAGNFNIAFNASYNNHYQTPIVKRLGDIRTVKVINRGTDASPVYDIGDYLGAKVSFILPLTPGGVDATIGTNKASMPMPYGFFITDLQLQLTTFATGTTLFTVDVNKNGTSILSTKLTLDASETDNSNPATSYVFTSDADRTFVKWNRLSADIDSVGNLTTGQQAILVVNGYPLGEPAIA